jgi:ACS family tartrate transporter-like MFS transporter
MPSRNETRPIVSPHALSPALRRRVAMRLLPYLLLLYIVGFLDRVNISYAALEMRKDLGFTDKVLGTGLGIFFIGYVLLEIPSTLMVERWSARRWMARIMITWGIVASATGFIHAASGFYGARFLLGLAEAGFFPGIIVYLGHWFTERDRARAAGLFLAGVPISYLIGAPLSGVLLRLHWLSWSGWRWVLILEGAPAIVLGILNLRVLTDWPADADWLAPEERSELQAAIAEERRQTPAIGSAAVLKHPAVILLTVAYFLTVYSGYGFTFWLPVILQRVSGRSDLQVSLLSMLPYAALLVAMLALSWHSDRTRDRKWHAAVPLFCGAAGLWLATAGSSSLAAVLGGISIAGAALSFLPMFWSLPQRYCSGAAAAVAIGWISSIGNIGGFVGPFAVGALTRHGSFALSTAVLALGMTAAGVVVALLPEPRTASPR